MAKKKSSRQPKNLGEAVGFQNIFNNEKTDFFLGIILFLFSVYVIIAMVSFFMTGTADQSILEDLRPGEWMNANQEFQNYCGSFGAITSYWLMAINFGIPAFLIPLFGVICALQLMRAYHINLWKWFFGMAFVMVWCSVTFAKFLTPLYDWTVFNPGGQHGVFCVQQCENVIGPPGLTSILFLTAVIFLTLLTSETIVVIRKALNPIGYISKKVTFEITNHKGKQSQEDIKEEFVDDTKEPEDINEEPEDSSEVDEPDDGNLKSGVVDLDQKDTIEDGEPEESNIHETQPESLIAQQRLARLASEEAAAAAAEVSAKVGMDISVATDGEKASSNTVADLGDINTPYDPKASLSRYKYPTLDLLKKYDNDGCPNIDEEEQIANKNRIIEVLGNFGVQIKTIRATVGPTITLYEIQPAEGVRISRIKNLEDDIALSLAALGIRIIAPIPGKGTIGIEVPNAKPNIVSMESILNSKKFKETKMDLPIALGKTITNEVFMFDLAKQPHLLVAGATGQGKSVGLNAIITSLLYKKHPAELKFVLIDPKKVEFSIYSKISDDFMAVVDPDDEAIITDVKKVVRTLNSLCALMDHRYDLLKLAGARNIKEYNAKFRERKLNPEKGHEFMPYIVVIIDEFGDLIMTAGKEVELPIARIAQLARAIGIHMVIATQRPTTSIITGNIKANFPGRIAFKVSAGIDSKTILDRTGAQQLIGRGDMLYLNGNEPVRVQCAFVDTPEVERINDFIADQQGYDMPLLLPEPPAEGVDGAANAGGMDARSLDPYFEEAAHAIVLSQQGSTSMIQRRFSIGYNRAGRLMDQLEAAGIVGPAMGSKPRDVLIQDENSLNQLIAQLHS